MDFYEKLPTDMLIAFYQEILDNIERGILSKNMYYELGLIISVASVRGITLGKPCDFKPVVNQTLLDEYIQHGQDYHELKDSSLASCGL
ncbi:hypothetical protein AB1K84_02605 [Mesobacillus foraminis]|uniref:Uncharacterized protein n=1 Tax=Mesobacillus foraminis TaxID=279826 RepID=A0A4R2BGE9_9BACI|nr:hypothetical protein [Mesobacillus foraminis]MBT2759082.1 hypothetical protein [Mesobacillus foraminis]TCN26117.1 hypothetical protein EV146_104224 [Mesobacillus foraminis]